MRKLELKKDKKGISGGLITGIIFGVASLVIGVIIALVITSTLTDANLLTGQEDATVTNLTANFTAGIDAVAEQIPTVLLISAIVLIIAVLAILVGVWQRMKLGSSGTTL